MPWRTESDGRGLSLLAIDERLRYLVPFRPPEETAAYLRRLRSEGHRLAILADDGEKFGGWRGRSSGSTPRAGSTNSCASSAGWCNRGK